VRPGDLDAIPPLATQKVPFNQQQFGGNVGGPILHDRLFFSALRAAPRAQQVSVTSLEAPGTIIPTRRTKTRDTCARLPVLAVAIAGGPLYTWCGGSRTTNPAACSCPAPATSGPTTVDTLHNRWTSVVSDSSADEVRGQWSRYYDLRAAEV